MNSCLKWFSLLFIGCLTVSWVFVLPQKTKLGIKYTIHSKIFSPGDPYPDIGPNVTVTLSLGQVIGSTIKPAVIDKYKARSVIQFLGVPFARPPIGSLRFKKPLPVSKWSPSVLEATSWPAACMQSGINFDMFQFMSKEISEDCLYLNIWTPALPFDGGHGLRPVLVFIHGGGFFVGSSNQVNYHGGVLASLAEVVVVTINYRLGPFGFLASTDGTDAPGNAGLWDQVMALEWIQDHIRYFGGDPGQVTISGESAGSVSVSALFHSPKTRGMFKSIVTMSGSSLLTSAWGVVDRKSILTKTKVLAQIVNCSNQDESIMINCLIKKDARDLVLKDEAQISAFPEQILTVIPTLLFAPMHGDLLIPDPINKLIASMGDNRKDIRVLTGVTNFEGGLMRFTGKDSKSRFDSIKKSNDNSQWIKEVTNYLVDELKFERIEAEKVSKYYLDESKDIAAKERSLFRLIGDFYLTCPANFESEAIADKVQSINSYVFSYKSVKNELLNLMCPDEGLVCHALELSFFFGHPFLKSQSFFWDENDIKQAEQTIRLLGDFVRGDKLEIKRQDGNVEWKSYDMKTKTSLEMNHLKGNQFITDFNGHSCKLLKKFYV